MSARPTRRSQAPDRTPAAGRAAHLVHGADEYLVATHARALLERLCPPADQAFGAEEIDGRADSGDAAVAVLRRTLAAARTPGLLGGRKTVWLRDATFLADPKVWRAAAVTPWLDELVALVRDGLPSGHALILSTPDIDGRSSLFKAFETAGTVREFAVSEKAYLAEQSAAEQVRGAFKDAKLAADDRTQAAFLARVGTDTRQIRQEAGKLAVYLGDRQRVEPADIEAICSPTRETIVWDLQDALGRRDLAGALGFLRSLGFQKEEPVGLMAAIEARLRDLQVFRDCLDRRWASVSGRVVSWSDDPEAESALAALGRHDPRRLHPYRASLLAAQAQRFGAAELQRARDRALATREEIVAGFSNPALLLEFLLLRLLAPVRPKPAAPEPA
jgi:DNA polymerase-3 subunit delta